MRTQSLIILTKVMNRLRSLTLIAVAFTACLPAQDYRAKLTGEVIDATGAKMAKVRVELTSKASQAKSTTASNEAGLYLFQFLDSGEYRLTASSAGFKTFIQDGIR